MRALAITRTMCCSGGETDPVCLCFRARRAGEARKSRFQPKRLHNRREETSLLAKADQLFFLKNSTCVLAWGKGEVGGREHHGAVRRGAGNRTQSRPASQPSSQLPGLPTPPPQAATCGRCQPEGLKFLQLAGPMLKLGKQTGEEMQRN